MKTTRLLLILPTALICVSGVGCSTSKTGRATAPDTIAGEPASADDGDMLTGSYLRQNVRRSGMITDGCNQVVVLDQARIETSGAADVRELLLRKGIR